MNKFLSLFFIGFALFSCSNDSNQTSEHVDRFIRLYQSRSDFNAFLQLYDEDMVLEDMVAGYKIEGRTEFAEFFNWPDPRFEKLEAKTFIIQNVLVEGRKAVISGYFTPFIWDGQSVEAMQFTTLLYYDERGKIIKHIDWINYPNSLIDYSTRANSNEWISP